MEKKKTWGGAREGAGRKAVAGEVRKNRTLKATDAEWEKIKAFAAQLKKGSEQAFLIVSVVTVALFVGYACNRKNASEVELINYTVQSGDTYYSIAEKHFSLQSEKDIREFISNIKHANNTLDSRLVTGQVIVIPVNKE